MPQTGKCHESLRFEETVKERFLAAIAPFRSITTITSITVDEAEGTAKLVLDRYQSHLSRHHPAGLVHELTRHLRTIFPSLLSVVSTIHPTRDDYPEITIKGLRP